jgi:hypothetical protein
MVKGKIDIYRPEAVAKLGGLNEEDTRTWMKEIQSFNKGLSEFEIEEWLEGQNESDVRVYDVFAGMTRFCIFSVASLENQRASCLHWYQICIQPNRTMLGLVAI